MRFISITALALCLTSGSSQITRQECEDQGGEVVGDIGNGAIFRQDYVCDIDGLPPTDVVVAGADEPIAIEGEVCCGGNSTVFEFDGSGSDNITSAIRPEMSVDDCEAQGGVITYDIGDGSIHRDDYLCEVTGLPPIGTVIARSGESIPREGQVCCPGPVENATERDEYTRGECEGMNGIIVGDIGDGAIFEDDYLCDSNGLPPIANIVQDEEPFAIEGEVCCGEDVAVTTTAAERDEVSRQECEDLGGEIVGDIGDGATQSDDYVCESNGQAPIANVVAAEGEPIASEGEVCCGAPSEIDADGAFAVSFARLAGINIFGLAFYFMNLF